MQAHIQADIELRATSGAPLEYTVKKQAAETPFASGFKNLRPNLLDLNLRQNVGLPEH